MKHLILALLIFVFSAQGLGATAGLNVLNASRALASLETSGEQESAPAAVAEKADQDIDALQIFSIAEELSDYVLREPLVASLRHEAPFLLTAVWIPASIILSRVPPPPRA